MAKMLSIGLLATLVLLSSCGRKGPLGPPPNTDPGQGQAFIGQAER